MIPWFRQKGSRRIPGIRGEAHPTNHEGREVTCEDGSDAPGRDGADGTRRRFLKSEVPELMISEVEPKVGYLCLGRPWHHGPRGKAHPTNHEMREWTRGANGQGGDVADGPRDLRFTTRRGVLFQRLLKGVKRNRFTYGGSCPRGGEVSGAMVRLHGGRRGEDGGSGGTGAGKNGDGKEGGE